MPSREDYRVEKLEGLENNKLEIYAGQLGIPETNGSNLFFWLVKASVETNKLVVWLNGGPGCSSMDGLFLENGPFRVQGSRLVLANDSWHEKLNVLYVDQPIGVGFSFASSESVIPRNHKQITSHFKHFMQSFTSIFTEFKVSDIYLSGESFAGTYIPHIAKQLESFNIKGMIIINGWMDPIRQYQSYIDYSVANSLLSGEFLENATMQMKKCLKSMENPVIQNKQCNSIIDYTLNQSKTTGNCLNMFDIRLRDKNSNDGCGDKGWPIGSDDTLQYLQSSKLHSQLNLATPIKYESCSELVERALDDDPSTPSYILFNELLESMDLLLITGDQDLMCNWMGVEQMVNNLYWRQGKGFDRNSELKDLVLNNRLVAQTRYSRHLTMAIVKNASHMAPIESPAVCKRLVYEFTQVDSSSSLFSLVAVLLLFYIGFSACRRRSLGTSTNEETSRLVSSRQ